MEAQKEAATSTEQQQQQPSPPPPLPQSMEERFEEWMVTFERVYESAEEKERRFNIFKKRAEDIDAFNAGKHSYTQGLNQFSDFTDEEFSHLYGCRR